MLFNNFLFLLFFVFDTMSDFLRQWYINKNLSTTIKKAIDDFDKLKILGKGTFGKVVLCREKCSGQLFAIKMLKKAAIIEKDEVIHTLTEKNVLCKSKHPFIIVSIQFFKVRSSLKTNCYSYLVFKIFIPNDR